MYIASEMYRKSIHIQSVFFPLRRFPGENQCIEVNLSEAVT